MNSLHRTIRKKKAIALFFFLTLVFIGFFIYKDYGLSWDEPISHRNGEVSLNYVTTGDDTLWTYSERFYGSVIEMVFVTIERLFKIDSTQAIFFMRHIATYLIFLVGVFFFYRICYERFKSQTIGLLGAFFLVISPRVFSDAFYNSKDIPVMVFFIVSMYTLFRFLKTPTVWRALWHAVATALLIAIRIPGIFIPSLTIGAVMLNAALLPENRVNIKRVFSLVGLYVGTTIVFTLLFWPFLWQQPLLHFSEALADMSRFSRQLDLQVLYQGNFIAASALPWHYIPVWIIITTPFLYLLLFVFGLAILVKRFIPHFRKEYRAHSRDMLVLAWFFGPLIAVILFRSVLYDGWRHLYFIYPALLYIGLVSLEWFYTFIQRYRLKTRVILLGMLFISIIASSSITIAFMVRNHPYQNMYFNFISGGMERAREKFDFDYWGLSFREGLEYIASNDQKAIIPIFFDGGSPQTVLILEPEVMERFEILSEWNRDQARYVLSNYRWQHYDALLYEHSIFTVRVDGVGIMSVFKVR